MAMLGLRQPIWGFTVPGLVLVAGFWAAPASAQLAPDHPEVKAAVAKALGFLETGGATAQDPRQGAYALVGMAFLKNGSPPTHPKVVEAAKAIQQSVRSGVGDASLSGFDIYSLGLCVIFYCTLDPDQYRSEVLALLKALEQRQKPHGGWGYPYRSNGDTSMTQYGVLSMWEARQAGFEIPLKMMDGAGEWLLRTQDPSGAVAYQATPSNTFQPIPQPASEIRPSLAPAGLSSLYIAANMLRLDSLAEKERENQEEANKLPPALKEVQKGPRMPTRSRLDQKLFDTAKERGNRWLAANYKASPPSPIHVNYFLYALERYWSFREAIEGVPLSAPPWYSDGARWLLSNQAADGSWSADCGLVPDTAFGALFLLRSMKKSIERAKGFGRGVLVGGRGLPKGATDILLRQGQVVAKPLTGPAEGLLAAIENAESPEFAGAAVAMSDLSIADARKLVSTHEEKLRQLVSGGTPEARLAAVQALARSHDLDNVPTLIYALTDSDPVVILAARDGLRRMSRTFDTFGPPDQFAEEDVWRAVRQWKEWYQTIRPDAEFVD